MTRKIKVVEIENVETPETVETPSETVEIPQPVVEEPQEETLDEKVEEVEPPKESKPKKEDDKITCSICNKTMLMKTYKYTHQKLCKPVEPKSKPNKVVEPPKEKPKPKLNEVSSTNLGEVSFDAFKEEPNPLDIYRAAKEQRQQVRIQRVKSLISQAF